MKYTIDISNPPNYVTYLPPPSARAGESGLCPQGEQGQAKALEEGGGGAVSVGHHAGGRGGAHAARALARGARRAGHPGAEAGHHGAGGETGTDEAQHGRHSRVQVCRMCLCCVSFFM